ncbi:MAG: hypothetical protein AAGK21_03265 [Bacteroidota bacterium]
MRFLLSCALAALFTIPVQAQWVEDLQPPAEPEAAEAPPAEGIQVHGRWAITVRDPDGSVQSSTEFQNALSDNGDAILSRLIAGAGTIDPAFWSVEINVPGDDLCLDPNGNAGGCQITSAFVGYPDLTVSVEQEGQSTYVLYTGTISIDLAGNISTVRTKYIGNSTATGIPTWSFTYKVLDNVIPVSAGQTVDVRVEISFE